MSADPDEMADDLAAAVDERLAARLDAARRRRAHRERARAEKRARRAAGLRARHARKLSRINEKEKAMPDTSSTPNLDAHIAHAVEHYTPSVSLHNEGDDDERLVSDHVRYCLDRIREVAQKKTGDLQVPAGFEYVDADGDERWGDLSDPDVEFDTLRAGLAYAAAQAAALQRELFRITDQGIAFLRLLDEALLPGRPVEKEGPTKKNWYHPASEPCQPGCPPHLDEIAEYVSDWGFTHGLPRTKVTAGDVRKSLDTPAGERDELQRLIVHVHEEQLF